MSDHRLILCDVEVEVERTQLGRVPQSTDWEGYRESQNKGWLKWDHFPKMRMKWKGLRE